MTDELPQELGAVSIVSQIYDDAAVDVGVCAVKFRRGVAREGVFTFGRKPLVEYDGDSIFAELAVQKMFVKAGWKAVWVQTWGGLSFLESMPTSWRHETHRISIPAEILSVLIRIQELGSCRASFDVCAWRDGQVVIVEAKQSGKDRLTKPQTRFIRGAFQYGIPPERLIVLEWSFVEP